MNNLEKLLSAPLPEVPDNEVFNKKVLKKVKRYERFQVLLVWFNIAVMGLAILFVVPLLTEIAPVLSSMFSEPVSASYKQAVLSGAELSQFLQSPTAIMAIVSAFFISIIVKFES